MRSLPPLKSLQAFEVAARWLSFSKAAEELFVTPAAVSQQIKQLESYLGVVLFRRMTRAVQLTEEARAVLPLVTEGFDKLAEAVDRLAQNEASGLLTVSCVPTFAVKWLLPRLPHFSSLYPDIDVRLDASLEIRDFDRDGIDVGIRLGMGDYPGLEVTRILGEEVSPACSPKILTGNCPLRTPDDLNHHRLIHVDWGKMTIQIPDWNMWTKAAGVEGVKVNHGPRFTIESMAIEAAINGDGIALISHSAIAEELKAGRLIRPFDLTLRTDMGYWLVCPVRRRRQMKVDVFCEWLLAEAESNRTRIA
ncbi:transcriptional regulator GcvA [Parasedimentitalea maritima]|uniref:Transcriptional regulator GcvA n=1 Tax=Parasedimentitalea maritima TaxID=2578117 RepID=A0A6A4RCC9_9RHOB|nr:transcriptional regulator GcvA [Zongyanglinia marina]KAE9627677.1 transcriptional regulator GcvA [Zongyanglinia marina]